MGELPVNTVSKQHYVCSASGHHSTTATMISHDGRDVDGDLYGCVSVWPTASTAAASAVTTMLLTQ